MSRIRIRDRFASLSVTMYECTRSIRIGHLGRSLDQPRTLIAMDRARANRLPESHDSDHGIRQVAPASSRLPRPVAVEMSICAFGEASQGSPRSGSFAQPDWRKLTRRITSATMMVSSNRAGSSTTSTCTSVSACCWATLRRPRSRNDGDGRVNRVPMFAKAGAKTNQLHGCSAVLAALGVLDNNLLLTSLERGLDVQACDLAINVEYRLPGSLSFLRDSKTEGQE